MLWFAAVAFCSSALNNIFVTYMFSSFLRTQCTSPGQARPPTLSTNAALTPAWFLVAQCTFAVWNAVNDPLAGWLSDTVLCLGRRSSSSAPAALHRRAWVVRWGGLCWCLFFVLAWFPPSASWGAALAPALPWLPSCLTGLHFLCCLCLYDAALTLVEVNHAALLSDVQPQAEALPPLPLALALAQQQSSAPLLPPALAGAKPHAQGGAAAINRRRVRANTWVACAMAVGAVTSLPAHWAWEADCRPPAPHALPAQWWWPGYFRSFAVGMAAVCGGIFWCAADGLLEEHEGAAEQGGEAGQCGSRGCSSGLVCGSSGRRGRGWAGGRKGSTVGNSSASGSIGAWGLVGGEAHGLGSSGGAEAAQHTLRHRAAAATGALVPRSPSRALEDASTPRAALPGPLPPARAGPPMDTVLHAAPTAAGGAGGSGGGADAAGGSGAGAGAAAAAAAAAAASISLGYSATAAAALYFSSQSASPPLSPSAGFIKREGKPTFFSITSSSSSSSSAVTLQGKGSSSDLLLLAPTVDSESSSSSSSISSSSSSSSSSSTASTATLTSTPLPLSTPPALPSAPPPPRLSYLAFLRQLLALPSLRSYIAIATLQAFDCSFGKSFYTLFLAALWAHAFGEQERMRLEGSTQALLVCASFLLPHALTLLCEGSVMAVGIRRVLRHVVVLRSCLAVGVGVGVGVWLGPPVWWWGAVAAAGTAAGRSSALPPPHAPSAPTAAAAAAAAPALFLAAIVYQLLSRVTSETVCRNLSLLKASVVDDFRKAQGASAALATGAGHDDTLLQLSLPAGAGEGGDGMSSSRAVATAAAAAAGAADRDRPAALIGAADFFPRVAASAAPVLGYLLLHWGGSLRGGGLQEAGSVGPPSDSLLLVALVAIPGSVAAVQSALLKSD